ncbi:zinc-dependent metalloprotease [Moheibacter sediminis]|uniref:Por secretion system C-terminal sorting domain-containing protein n=1 Tax=Moheibacter sediminis TaxID=1434700 RepID=A0A1W2C4P4_9FLAO|nr:zinc-dependent metalloprotease [Moheibacter sediminis]SMC80113.1 Por secretion system C-terminal sorting domain-containing protein [Moheibacter sediminis]
MKNFFLCCMIPLCIGIHAQSTKSVARQINDLVIQKVEFPKFDILTETSRKNAEVDKVVNFSTLATINTSSLKSIYELKLNTLEISIPYQGEEVVIQLYQVDIFTDAFTVRTNKKNSYDYKPGVYYRGIIKGDAHSLASFNFFEDKFSGIVSNSELKNLNIGLLTVPGNKTNYVVYSDADLKVENNWTCGTEHLTQNSHIDSPSSMTFESATTTEKCVTMYYEMDYGLFTANGSDLDETMDWMSAAFNNLKTLYENDDITIALNEVFIWETMDPYQGAGDMVDYLLAFRDERPDFAGDTGQLIGINDDSGGGVAIVIDGLCSEQNHSYTHVDFNYQTIPTFSFTIFLMAHENGHIFGSPHTHACAWNGNNTAIDGCPGGVEGDCSLPGSPTEGGTIMSYCHFSTGINLSLGFGPQPKTLIINTVNNRECLSSDCTFTMSIEDINEFTDYSYYPNPVKDRLNISAKNEILEIKVFNMAGKKLRTQTVKSLDSQIDFSHYPSGTYIVELKFKEKPVTFKVIKK